MCGTSHTAEPVDAVLDRMNDPAVAAALITLLDNAELLSSLVVGLADALGNGEANQPNASDHSPETATAIGTSTQNLAVQEGVDAIVHMARSLGRVA